MKKLFTCLIFISFSGGLAASAQQLSVAPEHSVIGWTAASIKDPAQSTTGSTSTLQSGIHIHVPVKDRLYFGTGLLYAFNEFQVQSKAEKESGSGNIMRLRHLRLPLQLVYRIPVGYGSINLNAGGWMGYNIGGKWTQYIREKPSSQEFIDYQTYNLNQRFGAASVTPFEGGAHAGISYMLPVGFYVKAQYHYGLTTFKAASYNHMRLQFVTLGLGWNIQWTCKGKENNAGDGTHK